MSQPLFVLGMDRSGTSVITGALQRAGFSLGPEEMLTPADLHNPSGYFELTAIMQANERLLSILGLRHNPLTPLPEDWREYDYVPGEVRDIRQFLDSAFGRNEHEALKDPRISLLLPIYKTLYERTWSQGAALICVRNPLDVAKSINRRDYIPVPAVIGMWVEHTLCALRNSRGMRRTVILYEEFLRDPVAALKPQLRNYPKLKLAAGREAAIRMLVDPSLNHGQGDSGQTLRPELASRTYELCKRLAANNALFNDSAVERELDELWDELQVLRSFMPPAPAQGSLASLIVPGAEFKSVPYRPMQKSQTLRIDFEAAEGAEVLLMLSYWSGTIWMREMLLIDEQGRSSVPRMGLTTNIIPIQTKVGPGWNLVCGGPHCGFQSVGGKQQIVLTFSSCINPERSTDVTAAIWSENLSLRRRLAQVSGPSRAYAGA